MESSSDGVSLLEAAGQGAVESQADPSLSQEHKINEIPSKTEIQQHSGVDRSAGDDDDEPTPPTDGDFGEPEPEYDGPDPILVQQEALGICQAQELSKACARLSGQRLAYAVDKAVERLTRRTARQSGSFSEPEQLTPVEVTALQTALRAFAALTSFPHAGAPTQEGVAAVERLAQQAFAGVDLRGAAAGAQGGTDGGGAQGGEAGEPSPWSVAALGIGGEEGITVELLVRAGPERVSTFNAALMALLRRTLSPRNCFAALVLGRCVGAAELEEAATLACVANFPAAVRADRGYFRLLDGPGLLAVTSNSHLQVHQELDVWHAIADWVQHAWPARHGLLHDLLRAGVRLSQLDTLQLSQLQRHPLLLAPEAGPAAALVSAAYSARILSNVHRSQTRRAGSVGPGAAAGGLEAVGYDLGMGGSVGVTCPLASLVKQEERQPHGSLGALQHLHHQQQQQLIGERLVQQQSQPQHPPQAGHQQGRPQPHAALQQLIGSLQARAAAAKARQQLQQQQQQQQQLQQDPRLQHSTQAAGPAAVPGSAAAKPTSKPTHPAAQPRPPLVKPEPDALQRSERSPGSPSPMLVDAPVPGPAPRHALGLQSRLAATPLPVPSPAALAPPGDRAPAPAPALEAAQQRGSGAAGGGSGSGGSGGQAVSSPVSGGPISPPRLDGPAGEAGSSQRQLASALAQAIAKAAARQGLGRIALGEGGQVTPGAVQAALSAAQRQMQSMPHLQEMLREAKAQMARATQGQGGQQGRGGQQGPGGQHSPGGQLGPGGQHSPRGQQVQNSQSAVAETRVQPQPAEAAAPQRPPPDSLPATAEEGASPRPEGKVEGTPEAGGKRPSASSAPTSPPVVSPGLVAHLAPLRQQLQLQQQLPGSNQEPGRSPQVLTLAPQQLLQIAAAVQKAAASGQPQPPHVRQQLQQLQAFISRQLAASPEGSPQQPLLLALQNMLAGVGQTQQQQQQQAGEGGRPDSASDQQGAVSPGVASSGAAAGGQQAGEEGASGDSGGDPGAGDRRVHSPGRDPVDDPGAKRQRTE